MHFVRISLSETKNILLQSAYFIDIYVQNILVNYVIQMILTQRLIQKN
jgi:hypothetical protein